MSIRRAGGRSAIVRAKVIDAASDLILEEGLGGVTIPMVAQRAGVAVTSLYRRWGDINALLLDVAVHRLSTSWPLVDEGSIERDLKSWAARIAAGLRAREDVSFLRTLLMTWNVAPEIRAQVLQARAEEIEAMLQRGRDRGERCPSLDDIIDHLLAPLYVRSLLCLPLDEALAEGLVKRLL